MTSSGRRDFLKMAGLVAAAGVLPASIRAALAVPARRTTGTIADVKHVVILMQENRSFDHYFGMLRGVRGFGDPRPLMFADGTSVWQQPNAQVRTEKFHARGIPAEAPYVMPFHLDTLRNGEHQPGTDHGWSSGHLAYNHGRYNQWVNQKQDALTMGYLLREDLRFHYALADAFTICDAYHASAMSDTAVNRIFHWTGTCDPRNRFGSKPNGPGLEERPDSNGYTWTTYAERLEKAGVSWKLYQGGTGEPDAPSDNYTDNSLEFFARFHVGEGADPNGPLVTKGVSTHTLQELRDDVRNGKLPAVSWVVAPFKYCEHPDAAPSDGAHYIDQVLSALTSDADSWSQTVLFLNYDENDGLFDHVVPPMPPIHSAPHGEGMVSASLVSSLGDEILDLDAHPQAMNPLIPGADPGGLQPIGLGTRVPMIVISPWTTGGWVCSQTFDHTSVLQFLEKRFGVAEPQISAWRRAVCGDLTSAFDFAQQPAAAPHIQAPAPTSTLVGDFIFEPADALPVPEQGTRPARAVPYSFTVGGRLEALSQTFTMDFDNRGPVGAAFYVYDMLHDTPPRRYAVAHNDHLTDWWTIDGAYALAVHGPEGFLREFRGDGSDALDVRLFSDETYATLSIVNRSDASLAYAVANAYEHSPARGRQLQPGESAAERWPLADHARWYDLSVTVTGNTASLWRFAGHIGNGLPSTSDPGNRRI
jgi:phospholipase C